MPFPVAPELPVDPVALADLVFLELLAPQELKVSRGRQEHLEPLGDLLALADSSLPG